MSKSWFLKNYLTTFPTPDDFKVVEGAIPTASEDGDVVVENTYVTVDPYMRGRMSGLTGSYVPSFALTQPVGGESIGKVIESRDERFPVGAVVSGAGMWTTHYLGNADGSNGRCRINYTLPADVPQSLALGVVGMPGNTAYFGTTDILQPVAGETMVVSAAAGAVGSVVCQLGKAAGCRVVGITSTAEKGAVLKELGVDEVVLHRTTPDEFSTALKAACPNGIDMYFENVGGFVGTNVFKQLNTKARVAVCGCIAEYNGQKYVDENFSMIGTILTKQVTVRGFIVSVTYLSRWGEGLSAMAQHIRDGTVKAKETVVEGFNNIPAAFMKLFASENIGKVVCKI